MGKAKIIVSSNSGFCFGVRRALDIAEGALRKQKTIYSLGPIIHNPQVCQEFSQKGLRIAKDIEKVSGHSALLIPSHGVSPDVLKKRSVSFVDTTCPLVGRVQKIVKGLKDKGYFIIIVGNKKHPEVKGLKGMAGKNSRVLKDKEEARSFSFPSKSDSHVAGNPKKVALISQTTASLSNFKEILSEIAKKDFTELASFNTVCKNTIDRQKEAASIAKKVDAMIVIGGKNSANTSKLARVCKNVNKHTCHIESFEDLRTNFLKKRKIIGIATGASTPPYAIREVIKKIRRIDC